ncbi:hypothetical protein Clacol_002360 [Clathrus columnatus]|uniref:Uncharacterized protein n=1 Tax=Clathrus columnatus TaxID=1419009 RepID=A0AAV5A3F2_9AGAM|nr:hypothetical protein Clacol_002360 [Clathrus columnatus]
MLPTTIIILATSFITALAVPIAEQTVSDILTDLATTTTDILCGLRFDVDLPFLKTALESALDNLASAGVDGLSAVSLNTNRLIADIQRTTASSAATGPLSETDAHNVAANVGTVAEGLIDVFNLYVGNKPLYDEFAKIVPNLISQTEQVLENLGGAVSDLSADLVKNAPADVDNADAPVRAAVEEAIATALATYQS